MPSIIKTILTGLLNIILASCVNEDIPDNTGIEPGDSLPAFSIILNDGRTVSNLSLRGKVGVIEFFNTSCSDCRRSLPVLQEVYDSFIDNEEIDIFCVAREEDALSIENYWKANSLTLPFSPQTGREVYSLFASIGIPRIYIIDKSGAVRYCYDDSNAPTAAELEGKIRELVR